MQIGPQRWRRRGGGVWRVALLSCLACDPVPRANPDPAATPSANQPAAHGGSSSNVTPGGGAPMDAAGSAGQSAPAGAADPGDFDAAAWVDPLIGTGGLVPAPPGSDTTYEAIRGQPPKFPFGGLTYPGAVVPFGMVALSPDVQRDGLSWVAGYNYYDDTILGFSHMKTSGNGHAFGHVLLVPSVGKLELQQGESPEQGYRSYFEHEHEHAEAGYYSVQLHDETGAQLGVELTATVHAGMHRYTFPQSAGPGRILIDLIHAVGPWNDVQQAQITKVSESEVAGFRFAAVDKGPIHFVAQFSKPLRRFQIASEGALLGDTEAAAGTQLQAVAEFDPASEPVVVVKVGLSWVSVEGARANLSAEIPSFDFDFVRQAAHQTWASTLGKVKVEGGSDAERRTFYTALYHAQLSPFEFADRDGQYLGADGAIHHADYQTYTFFSLWDAFRAAHPLLTLLEPQRVGPIVSSMLAFGDQNGGLLPTWGLAGRDWGNMVGLHSMPVVAEAHAKGLRDFDAGHALSLMQENMLRDVVGLPSYRALGYVAADQEQRSAAATLELAYDDYCISELASALGVDAAEARERALSYRSVFDPAVGFSRGRFTDGTFRSPFDPRTISHYGPSDDFVEANSWQSTWFAPHDVAGLMALMGGRDACVQKLDGLFEEPSELLGRYSADVTGMWGQYAQGNEQSHHVAYLYAWAGAPWKTQARVREIMRRFYSDRADGLPGNDDAGQMSAWYVFSALGFYPVNPVSGEYVLGSPLFDRASIDVGGGKLFVVEAENNAADRPYIQSAELNGMPFARSFITHAELVAGGSLRLSMGAAPNPSWASAPDAAPSSFTSP